MGRRRIELRPIEDRASRLASFSKRRAGLLKKARELAVLCDAEVGLLIVSPRGKLSYFSSGGSIKKTIRRYQKLLETEPRVKKHVNRQKHSKEFACQKLNPELLEVARRLSDGECTVKLPAPELEGLLEQLGGALKQVRDRKMKLLMDSLKHLRGRERRLLQERRKLQQILGKDEDEGDKGCNDTADQHNHSSRNGNRDSFQNSSKEGCHEGDEALALRLWPPFQVLG